MRESDREGFAGTLLTIGKMFGKIPDTDTLKIYWESLRDLTLETIQTAIHNHLRDPEHCHFMPMPGDIIRLAGFRRQNALTAWAEVIDTMESVGAYGTVMFEDGVVNAVIRDLGGWPEVCYRQTHDEEEIWLQKEFERRYNEYLASGRFTCLPLIGLHDENNIPKGYYAGPKIAYIASGQMIEPKLLVERPQKQIESAPEPETPQPLRLVKP